MARRSLLSALTLLITIFPCSFAQEEQLTEQMRICSPDEMAKINKVNEGLSQSPCNSGAELNSKTHKCVCKEGFRKYANGPKGPYCLDPKEPDFTGYIKNLQKRIRKNWHPPNYGLHTPSLSTAVLFKLSKDGDLKSACIQKSSNDPSFDQKAYEAILKTAPYQALPMDFKGNEIDTQFIFDIKPGI